MFRVAALVLDDLAVSFAAASRRAAWTSVDDWLHHAEYRWSPYLLTDIPHRHVLAVTGVLHHRRMLARSAVLGSLWVTVVAVTLMLWAHDVPLTTVGILAVGTFAPVFLCWLLSRVLSLRLERRVRRDASAVATLSPAVFSVLLENYLGPAPTWRVSLMWPSIVTDTVAEEHPVGPVCLQGWASRQAERALTASRLTSSQRETFEVLARDGYVGSVEDLLEVSRRL